MLQSPSHPCDNATREDFAPGFLVRFEMSYATSWLPSFRPERESRNALAVAASAGQDFSRAPSVAHESLKLALQEHCREKLAPFKYPRWLEFRAELPKTATGKIQRFKLRAEAPAH